ncbi:MAG TPA: helix-turn-helix domain-containing protein [Terriglobia bacterium]|nr:helix-turn-helix domain-containing protein [Terriglobia bacterium]
MNEKLSLTLGEASSHTGLSQRTIYNLIAAGKLRSTKIGKRRLVLYDSLEALITGKRPRREEGR